MTLRPPGNVKRNPCAACGLPLEADDFERTEDGTRLQHKRCPSLENDPQPSRRQTEREADTW